MQDHDNMTSEKAIQNNIKTTEKTKYTDLTPNRVEYDSNTTMTTTNSIITLIPAKDSQPTFNFDGNSELSQTSTKILDHSNTRGTITIKNAVTNFSTKVI
jgi:hypothetical protein